MSAFSLRVPSVKLDGARLDGHCGRRSRAAAGPGSPGRRQVDLIAVDVIERARRVGGRPAAVGEVHVAAEVRLLDRAEARLGLRRSSRATARCRSTAGRSCRGRARLAVTRRRRRTSRSAGPCPAAPVARRASPTVIRCAGASPSAGRSTCTFSVRVEVGHGRAVGRHRRCRWSCRRSAAPARRRRAGQLRRRRSRSAARAAASGRRRRRSGRCRAPTSICALSPVPVIRLLPRSCSVCTRLSSWRRAATVISSASMVRPSASMCAVPVELDVVLGAREAGRAGGGVERPLPFSSGVDGDVRLGEQPEHLAVAIVGGADAGALHPAARERHRPRDLEIPALSS